MSHETFALINEQDQVVNHIVINKDDANFETNMAGQLEYWSCVRYVETTEDTPVIILDPSPEIWTIHTEAEGFVLPQIVTPEIEIPDASPTPTFTKLMINGRAYPSNSLLIKENAHLRPIGYIFPEDEDEVSLEDID